VLDVWDFGEPPSGMYDDDIFSEDENDPEEEDGDDPTHRGMRVLHEEGLRIRVVKNRPM